MSTRRPRAKRTARRARAATSRRGKGARKKLPPCSLHSIGDLHPQNICACARGMLELLAEARQMMEQPQNVVEKLMVQERYRFGPRKIKGTPGWWFRAYRPELEITGSNKLKLTVKAGVKKTRGALQFGWRTADHTFTIPLPAQYQQYRDMIARIGEMEDELNLLVTNVCGPLGY